MNDASATSDAPRRRSVVTALLAAVVGGLCGLLPVAAGLGVALDPLRRRVKKSGTKITEDGGKRVRVCQLAALPEDGTPQAFPVIADTVDAWTFTPSERIGAVYLARTAGAQPEVRALSSECPHLGCSVEFNATADEFQCPCHVSGFSPDGAKRYGPSPRGMDALEVEVMDGEVWVTYQRYKTSIPAKVPAG